MKAFSESAFSVSIFSQHPEAASSVPAPFRNTEGVRQSALGRLPSFSEMGSFDGNKNPPCSGGFVFRGSKDQSEPRTSYLTASIFVTANSPCSLSKVPVTLTFLVSLQISLWKPLETSPVNL